MVATLGIRGSDACLRDQFRTVGPSGEAGRIRWDGAVFLIEYQGHIVGQLSLGAISYGAMRTATMGYWMDERWIGHGFAPLAVAMASDWALTDPSGPRLHRIEIAILPENRRSKRVVEKLRARYEGVRLRYMYINGVWRDHEVFVLMTEDIQESVLARLQH